MEITSNSLLMSKFLILDSGFLILKSADISVQCHLLLKTFGIHSIFSYTEDNTGGPPLVLIFGGKKTPHYMKSALFGDYFSTKTHEMGEIIFQSPLFEVFPSSQSSLFRNFQIHFVFKALSKLYLDRKWLCKWIYFVSTVLTF